MEVMLNLILVPSAKVLDIHTNDNQGYLVVSRARPLRKGREGGKRSLVTMRTLSRSRGMQ